MGSEDRHHNESSGSMRHRAALLRALLIDTHIVLLEEPFGELDTQSKQRMQEWLLQLRSDFKKAIVFITHDIDEAIFLSDEIHVMGTRPRRIMASITIDIPRPRGRSVVTSPSFIALNSRCLDLLHVPLDATKEHNAA